MEELRKKLVEARPHLSASSIKTYMSILSNLYAKMKGAGDPYDFFKKNTQKILEHLKDEKPNLRKTKLAVVISLLGDNGTDALKVRMLEDANQYNASLRDQTKNEKQDKNWVSSAEIQSTFRRLGRVANPLLKKDKLTKKEYNEVLNYVLLALYVLIPPRRSQDFSEMKIRNFDKDKDNHYDGKTFVFLKYKTAAVYGKQEVKPSAPLKRILNQWVKINPHDFLLTSYDGNKLSVSRMTLLLNKIFGKNVSTTMLRHVYISENVLKNAPTLNQMEKVATEMAHSVDMQSRYRVMDTDRKPTDSIKRSIV